jgi:hypothetical protein
MLFKDSSKFATDLQETKVASFYKNAYHSTFSGKPGTLVAGYLALRDAQELSVEFQYFPEELKWSLSRNNDEKTIFGQSWSPNWAISAGNETCEFEVLFNSFYEDRVSPYYASKLGVLTQQTVNNFNLPQDVFVYNSSKKNNTIPSVATDDLYTIWAPEDKSLEAVWVLYLAHPAMPSEVLIDSIDRTDSFYEDGSRNSRRAFWSIKLRRHFEIPDPQAIFRKVKSAPKPGPISCEQELKAYKESHPDSPPPEPIMSSSGGEEPTSPEE